MTALRMRMPMVGVRKVGMLDGVVTMLMAVQFLTIPIGAMRVPSVRWPGRSWRPFPRLEDQPKTAVPRRVVGHETLRQPPHTIMPIPKSATAAPVRSQRVNGTPSTRQSQSNATAM